jgi:DNA polymerase-3 subunit delta'
VTAVWLRAALKHDRLAHAYLLTGPRGVGRRRFALEVASALNCLAESIEDRPDHACQQCRLIERNVHPDVRIVRRAPERRAIHMRPPNPPGPQRDFADNVEFIQSDAQLRPVLGRKKVYIILNAEELAQDAADRLLKTLEEPPPFVVFLLTAVERGAVFPTIASRCQELRLRPLPRAEQVRDPDVAARELAYAQQLVAALGGSRLDRLLVARGLSERWTSQPETVRETLRAWMSWWRDLLLVQLSLSDRTLLLDATGRSSLESAAQQISRGAARATAARLQQTLADLDANVNPRLALDLLLLKLPVAQ